MFSTHALSVLSSTYTSSYLFFFFNDPPTTEIYTLSLHDALPIFIFPKARAARCRSLRLHSWPRRSRERSGPANRRGSRRSEEHTSELQSLTNLVCRLLLEKKKTNTTSTLA